MGGFVLETNARSSSAFPHPTDDADAKLRDAFGRMDGDRLFAFLLWELPADRSFENGLRGTEPQEFIQCAGAADALTVELRERDEGGRYVLSTLARAHDEAGPRDVVIEWRGNTKEVHRNEQWTSEGAAGLFLTYWRTRALPTTSRNDHSTASIPDRDREKNRTNPTRRINGWKSVLNTLTIRPESESAAAEVRVAHTLLAFGSNAPEPGT